MKRIFFPTVILALAALACGSSDKNLIGQGGQGGTSEGGASQGGMATGGDASEGGMGGSPTGTASGSPSGTPTGSGDLPCGPTVAWAATWETLEGELLTLINERRQAGGTCGSDTHGSLGPLTVDPIIRDVARAHAEDMAVADYFGWSDEGNSWNGHFTDCGYGGSPLAGGLTLGHLTAQEAFDAFVGDPTICNSMHFAAADAIGIGHYQGGSYGAYWVFQLGTGN